MNSNVRKEERLLNVGILGCGLISQAAHLIGCTKARNIKLQAICDVSEELRDKMAAVYQPERVYADYEQMRTNCLTAAENEFNSDSQMVAFRKFLDQV